MEGTVARVGPARFKIGSRWGRFVAYGLAGWCAEVMFTGVHDFVRHPNPRLPARSSMWMFLVYGLLAPLFEPLHDRMRKRPMAARAAAYGAGILAVEYAAGRVFRKVLGVAPWDYAQARFSVDGLIRLDYFPLWALAGLGAERLHDVLTGRARG